MPCDSVRLMSVTLDKSDAPTMHAALKELGFQPCQQGDVIYFGNGEWINTKTGQAKLADGRSQAAIKQAYSKAIVLRTAKKYGWQIQQDAKNPNKLQILKR